MASLLRRSKLWDSFVPPPGFERPRTAELKFLIFFATAPEKLWWHPTEVAIRVGSGNIHAAQQLCIKLNAGDYLLGAPGYIQKHSVQYGTYKLERVPAEQAMARAASHFVVGYQAKAVLRSLYESGWLLGMFRIPKNNRQSVQAKIFEYFLDYPEPVALNRLKRAIRESKCLISQFLRHIRGLVRRRRLELVQSDAQSEMEETYRMTSSEWLKQETKRREREEREQVKKAKAQRKRRRTLKKKAKARKRPSRRGALEL